MRHSDFASEQDPSVPWNRRFDALVGVRSYWGEYRGCFVIRRRTRRRRTTPPRLNLIVPDPQNTSHGANLAYGLFSLREVRKAFPLEIFQGI